MIENKSELKKNNFEISIKINVYFLIQQKNKYTYTSAIVWVTYIYIGMNDEAGVSKWNQTECLHRLYYIQLYMDHRKRNTPTMYNTTAVHMYQQ